jgi:hypothetical protein
LEDADAVLDGFFASCFYRNQTEPCTLALHYPSASAAKEAFVDFMETDLKYNPLPAGPYLIEYGNVKDAVFQYLYMPRFWPTILEFVYAIMTRDLTVLLDGEGTEYTSFASVIANYERKAELEDIILDRTVGIWCADKPDRIHSATLEEVKPVVEQMRAKSWISGDGLPLRFTTRCAHWNMPAKERVNPLKVDGPPVKTKKPVLLVGTSYDPATPIASAFNMSAGLEGSVVLRHNGYGVSLLCSYDQLRLLRDTKLTKYLYDRSIHCLRKYRCARRRLFRRISPTALFPRRGPFASRIGRWFRVHGKDRTWSGEPATRRKKRLLSGRPRAWGRFWIAAVVSYESERS